MHMFNLNQ